MSSGTRLREVGYQDIIDIARRCGAQDDSMHGTMKECIRYPRELRTTKDGVNVGVNRLGAALVGAASVIRPSLT